jgi:hypothetical protein
MFTFLLNTVLFIWYASQLSSLLCKPGIVSGSQSRFIFNTADRICYKQLSFLVPCLRMHFLPLYPPHGLYTYTWLALNELNVIIMAGATCIAAGISWRAVSDGNKNTYRTISWL